MTHSRNRFLALIAGSACLLTAATGRADLTEAQVLVVYNSASADAAALLVAYQTAHPGIPAANVLDLNDAALLTADLTQAEFIAGVRDPIRTYLLQAGAPAPEDIVAIVLLRPFPHRVLDSSLALAGDSPSTAGSEFNAGDANYASVDSELTLLWQELYTGEAGGTMDSLSDNVIENPYHGSGAGIHTFSRAAIQTAKTFTNAQNVAWRLGGSGTTRLTPGDMYLVCRIDGHSLAEAEDLIARSSGLVVNRPVVKIILDEYDLTARPDLDDDPLLGSVFFAGDDYEETRDLLVGWNVIYDDTFDFIDASEEPSAIVAYASYGENHDIGGAGENPPGAGTYIDDFFFAPGAIFNTIESYNGRALNGLGTKFNQEQAADFIAAGGTFAVGSVFEPFSFSIPDNEFLFQRMLVPHKYWGEAAYMALPALSWQHLVIGDPLARFSATVYVPGDCSADGQLDQDDVAGISECMAGPEAPIPLGCDCADVIPDEHIDLVDFLWFQKFFTIF